MYLYHIAEKDLLKNSGLKITKTGIENTIVIINSKVLEKKETISKLNLL